MRKIITAICSICGLTAYAQQDITLCGEWQFMLPDGQMKTTVTVPHTYNIMEGLEDYVGEAVYSRELPVAADMKGKTVRICFNGVYHDATVSVNGQPVGEHLGKGYTPFSFDITRQLRFDGSRNTVEVRCSNAYTEQSLPYMRSFDWSSDGGIYRPVRLHEPQPAERPVAHPRPADVE